MKDLPDEIVLEIIAYLDPTELVVLQHVSRRLLSLSRDNNLWKALCFTHSVAERRRRRRRLNSAVHADPRLAQLITAANTISSSATSNREKPWDALRTNWDPSFPGEQVDWYRDFVQRHAPQRVGWFEPVGTREATGVAMLFGPDKLVAPLDDGRICLWDASACSDSRGRLSAASNLGLLQSSSTTAAVECVSIDSMNRKGFFAVQDVLTEVDLNTLQVVARSPFPFPITALSESHSHSPPRTPLTVGTNWTIHLHDTRLATGDVGAHASLAQPGALSILHLPPVREWDASGDIWVAGRFTSILNFDRRFFPRLRGTLHSGARISCLASLPHPFIPNGLRTTFSPSQLYAAKSRPGFTLVTAGEYKGKGSLELYGLSPDPERSVNASDNRSTRSPQACHVNRQTASSSKLLSVAPQGTRLVYADGEGNLKWVERDGTTPVRQFNINEGFEESMSTHDSTTSSVMGGATETGWGEIVQKILPTNRPSSSLLTSQSRSILASSGDRSGDDLVIWTGDGRLGLVGFGTDPGFGEDVFEDALETQEADAGIKVREREYGIEMRRALEIQARELRWLSGYGL